MSCRKGESAAGVQAIHRPSCRQVRQNATKAITTDDVVSHLGVSRSLAALRFREYQGETIREVILKTRLEEVKKRLATTSCIQGRTRLQLHRHSTPAGCLQETLRASNGQVATDFFFARARMNRHISLFSHGRSYNHKLRPLRTQMCLNSTESP